MSEADGPIQIGKADLQGHIPLRSREFAQVNRRGRVLRGRRVLMKFIAAPDGQSRLGPIVSRRYSRRAVSRNRARRLIRETFRLLRHGFTTPIWLVVIARKHLLGCRLQDLQAEAVTLLTQAEILDVRDV